MGSSSRLVRGQRTSRPIVPLALIASWRNDQPPLTRSSLASLSSLSSLPSGQRQGVQSLGSNVRKGELHVQDFQIIRESGRHRKFHGHHHLGYLLVRLVHATEHDRNDQTGPSTSKGELREGGGGGGGGRTMPFTRSVTHTETRRPGDIHLCFLIHAIDIAPCYPSSLHHARMNATPRDRALSSRWDPTRPRCPYHCVARRHGRMPPLPGPPPLVHLLPKSSGGGRAMESAT